MHVYRIFIFHAEDIYMLYTHLNAIVNGVEKIASSNGVQHRIVIVIDNVVRRNRWQSVPLECVKASARGRIEN